MSDAAEVEAALAMIDNELANTEDALTEWSSRESNVSGPTSYSGQTGYTSRMGYTGITGYSGEMGYSEQTGYTGQTAYTGPSYSTHSPSSRKWGPTPPSAGLGLDHRPDHTLQDLMGVALTCLPTFSHLFRVPPNRTALAPSQNARKILHVRRRFNPLLGTETRGFLLIRIGSLPIPLICALQLIRRRVLPHR